MCVETFEGDRNRTLLRNIVYVGALAALLEIDMDIVGEMLREKFSKKKALLDANFRAIQLGYDYAKANYTCPLPFHLEQMDATKDSILLDGNSAAALGAVYAGATVGAWYPITPSTSLMEAFKEYCERFRVDPETKQTQVRTHSGGGRAGGRGHGDRRRLVRRALVHVDRRPRHLADE